MDPEQHGQAGGLCAPGRRRPPHVEEEAVLAHRGVGGVVGRLHAGGAPRGGVEEGRGGGELPRGAEAPRGVGEADPEEGVGAAGAHAVVGAQAGLGDGAAARHER